MTMNGTENNAMTNAMMQINEPDFNYTMIVLFCFYVLYEMLRKFVEYSTIFKHLNEEKKSKCTVYMYEIIGTIIILIIICYKQSIKIMFDKTMLNNLTANEIQIQLTCFHTSYSIICVMYTFEMIGQNKHMRWTLKLHHIATIVWVLLGVGATTDIIDSDILIMGMLMILYTCFETNIFIGLLMYRINANKFWIFHAVSTTLYIITRFFTSFLLIYNYIIWSKSDFVQNKLFNNTSHKIYLITYISTPLLILIVNYTQLKSIQALIHITKTVRFNTNRGYQVGIDNDTDTETESTNINP